MLQSLSAYERETVDMVVDSLGVEIEPEPEGKIIESIEVRPLDVLEYRDPLPEPLIDFLNFFHVTSRPFTVEREVLQRVGQRYRQELIEETARNLRSIRQFSLALAIPLRGSRPDKVRLLVITKDIWSLRMNSDFRIAGGNLERLLLQPSEENLFGTHHSVSAQFILEPDTYSLGGRYKIPRIGDSWLEGSASINVIVNKDTGDAEGSFGTLAYGQPLYSFAAEWAWSGSFAWRNEITRRFIGIELDTYDAAVTPEDDAIPYVYDSDLIAGAYQLTRSFGRGIKHNFTGGAEASRLAYTLNDTGGAGAAAVDEFRREALPVSDTRVYPFIQYRTKTTRYMEVLDFETMGLQEDYRLGHDFMLKLYPVTTALNSSRDFFGTFASASYTVPMADGLVRPYVESRTEVESNRVADAHLTGGMRVVTPRLGIGRLVLDGFYLDRYRNFLNAQQQLGGSTRLRGYPTGAFLGEDTVAANLEYRSRPLKVETLYASGTLFFDTGDAFDGASDLQLKQSAGFGLRILFPQLDRSVFRADWGLPLTKVPELGITGPFPGDIVITFRQAFPMPSIPLDE